MKKYVQNFWVRIVACFLCTIAIVGCGFSAVAMLFYGTTGTKEDAYKKGEYILANNYAIYALECAINDEIDELDTFLENTNIFCSISKNDMGAETVDIPVYTNGIAETVWIYDQSFSNSAWGFTYNLDALWPAMNSYVGTYDYEQEYADIEGFALDKSTGLFYYITDVGYFKADYIYVCSGEYAFDYELQNMDGTECYYNGYYGLTLDTSNYEVWDWFQLAGIILYIDSENFTMVEDTSAIEQYIRDCQYSLSGDRISYQTDAADEYYTIKIAVDENLKKDDLFLVWYFVVEDLYAYEDGIEGVFISSVLLAVLAIALLICSAKTDRESLGFFHKVPILILTGATVFIEIVMIFLCIDVVGNQLLGSNMITVESGLSLIVFFIILIVLLAVLYLQNIITRIKTKTFWRYSEFYYISKPIRKLVQLVRENIPLFAKGFIALGVITLLELIVICEGYTAERIMVFFILYKIVEIPLVLFILFQMKMLQDGSKRIASGDLSQPIDASKLFGEFKKHGENINKVGDSICIAVEERMKSERLKTELITNVSHDIKTPLTSIINYVDLIKKEDVTDPTLQEYVDVLDRQSARLKKLIEDLMEASKASTGNLTVNLEVCNMDMFISQVVGEFEERFAANGIEVILEKSDQPVYVSVDGRHMWRVLDNLLNNACKYSQSNTRLYISLKQKEEDVTITFKNISKTALNIPSEELMERFVRGDSSRNTEGSGLGLSIAQSLTELMNGTLTIDIDGDLFKVVLTFPVNNK